MATKKVCDRCGKEIKKVKLFRPRHDKPYEIFLNASLDNYGLLGHRKDLCYDCYKELKKFLNIPDSGDLTEPSVVNCDSAFIEEAVNDTVRCATSSLRVRRDS